MKPVLLSISGPTAIGKTAWAIRLARHFGTEILSADSRQFYREMRIGTAVPEPGELLAAPHHFIQHLSIHDPYSVGDYARDALACLRHGFRNHPLMILVGGSGLYTDAVTKGLDAFPEVAPGVREELTRLWETQGLEALQNLLAEKDPVYHAQVDLQNPHRLIRALEVCLSGDLPYSGYRGKATPPDFFHHLPLALEAPREMIYRRIEARVDAMMAAGLLEEARKLYPMRHLNALQTVGYQELFRHLEGEYDLDTAVAEVKKNTRRFAKRQLTWLRRDANALWVPYDADPEAVIGAIQSRLETL